MDWYAVTADEVRRRLATSAGGLTRSEAARRLQEYGLNEIIEKKRKTPLGIFIKQFKDFMILFLVAAAAVSGFIGDVTDTVIILVIVVLNALIGFIQEYRAEHALAALKKMAAHQATVLREGNALRISASQLVPGDVLMLEAGDAVPADLRLIEVFGLRIDESPLTGESVSVDKKTDPLPANGLLPGDRLNMAFKGTYVTQGRGTGVVTGTGMQTEIGRIADLLQTQETLTPLQKRMGDFGRKLSYVILLICLALFAIGLARGEEVFQMLLLSISLAVAAIPEALPALITIALARGAKRLVRQQALIRRLPAVETLGSITYICSDKTGTLTLNKMTVTVCEEADTSVQWHDQLSPLELMMALNHDVKKGEDGKLLGDPTEVALVEFLIKKFGREVYLRVNEKFPRLAELAFDSDRKLMSTLHRAETDYLFLCKGSIESLLQRLENPALAHHLHQKANELAAGGNRVLAFGYRRFQSPPENFSIETAEQQLHITGIVAMMDPPRKEVKEAITECKTAGIFPVMITGDHPATAAAIARDIGIMDHSERLITGLQLQSMPYREFLGKVESTSVYARVSPEQKLKIVKALQQKNQFVSMTGDGVNDAPCLRSADIGVAMGIKGSDVSKEAAHMVLLDDNFATIVHAVKEGRRIYDNIRKFVKYIMTCNSAEILTLFLAPLLGLPVPLLPIHILWINLVTDGLPGLALAGEKAEKDIMLRPPRKPTESLFAGGIGFHILWVALLMAGVTLIMQATALHSGNERWQTMVFTVLSFAQLGHALAIRSERDYLFRQGLFSNLPLVGAILLTSLLQLAVIYWPLANEVFKTQPLSLIELLVCLAASAIVFHAVEMEKWVKGRWKKNQPSAQAGNG